MRSSCGCRTICAVCPTPTRSPHTARLLGLHLGMAAWGTWKWTTRKPSRGAIGPTAVPSQPVGHDDGRFDAAIARCGQGDTQVKLGCGRFAAPSYVRRWVHGRC
jgi:hypothetical protein